MAKRAFHITHLRNLPAIVQGGLRCDRSMQHAAHVCIGYRHIKDRRMQRSVPCAAGGTLGDYVPFYFGPRSPMLFTINQRNTPDYQEGQTPIIHLVFAIDDLWQLGPTCAFTDRHAELGHALFSDDPGKLDEFVDWPLMKQDYWNDVPTYPDRKERRQAEFLVHQAVPWTAVHGIGVINVDMESQVRQSIASAAHQPTISVSPNWYY
ncbi:MAG: DUF4433 domain-containing protein [Planctomycetota bacterium]|nr:DUF4433 domain-containing protein [Planctomycetota bacterium]